jgi:hypothetical protein
MTVDGVVTGGNHNPPGTIHTRPRPSPASQLRPGQHQLRQLAGDIDYAKVQTS